MKCGPRAGWIFVGFGVAISLLFAILVLALANSKRRVWGLSGSKRIPCGERLRQDCFKDGELSLRSSCSVSHGPPSWGSASTGSFRLPFSAAQMGCGNKRGKKKKTPSPHLLPSLKLGRLKETWNKCQQACISSHAKMKSRGDWRSPASAWTRRKWGRGPMKRQRIFSFWWFYPACVLVP